MSVLVLFGGVLLVAWAYLWLGFHAVSGFGHLIAAVAVILIVWGLRRRGTTAASQKF